MAETSGRLARQRFLVPGLLIVAPITVTALVGTIPSPPLPLYLWNATESAPIGLYRLHEPARLRLGDLVAAYAPAAYRALAADRGYLPASVPVIKHVAAVPGDSACARGLRLFINGRSAARRLRSDARLRPLAFWQGCRRLRSGEYMLLGEGPRSFDSRYFGPVTQRAVIGRAVLLWRR